MKREEKGITLVALVITIIVLLILATVSILALTGDNGLFSKARESRNATNNGLENDLRTMNEYVNWMNNEAY